MAIGALPMTLETLWQTPDALFDICKDFNNAETPSTECIDSSIDDAMSGWPVCGETPMKHDHTVVLPCIDTDFGCIHEKIKPRGIEQSLSSQAKKARRQAQNRAAQRTLRERRENYVHELEQKTIRMTEEILSLQDGRQHLEELLNHCQAEVADLKTLPSTPGSRAIISASSSNMDDSQCLVFAIEIKIRNNSICEMTVHPTKRLEQS